MYLDTLLQQVHHQLIPDYQIDLCQTETIHLLIHQASTTLLRIAQAIIDHTLTTLTHLIRVLLVLSIKILMRMDHNLDVLVLAETPT